jgi:hypothetical protein
LMVSSECDASFPSGNRSNDLLCNTPRVNTSHIRHVTYLIREIDHEDGILLDRRHCDSW